MKFMKNVIMLFAGSTEIIGIIVLLVVIQHMGVMSGAGLEQAFIGSS